MAKNAVTDWDTTSGNNTDIAGININEGCDPGGINDAIRNIMSQVASWSATLPTLSGSPTVSGSWTFSGNPAFTGSPDFSGVANAATIRSDLGLEIGADVAAYEPPRSWQDVSGSRSANTTYQNTTGYDIEVYILGQASTARSAQVSSDNFVSDTVNVGFFPATGSATPNNFTVPNGHYYRINGSLTSISQWTERRT